MRGNFCVFEGIDGSGKSFLIKKISEYLLAKNYLVYLLNGETNPKYRELINSELRREIPNLPVLSLLFAAERLKNLEVLDDKLFRDDVVILYDRYYFSSLVYQAHLSKNFNQDISSVWVETINKYCIIPDKIIYLSIPIEEAMNRIENRNSRRDVYENFDFMKDALEAYDYEMKRYGGKVLNLNALESIDVNVEKSIKFILGGGV